MKVNYRTSMEHRNYANKTFVFETIHNLDEAIDELCAALGDNPDPFAEDLCPYYGLLWPSAEGLTQYIVEHKDALQNKRIIEIGSGLALPSFVTHYLGGKVIVSDFHPDVKVFFERNLRHNSMQIPYQTLDWCEEDNQIGKFDLVLASDVLYESRHPKSIAQAFTRLITEDGEIWLADPGRGYLQRFVDEMSLLGFSHELDPKQVKKDEIFVFRFYQN
jgi:predicted nicotinamide N-methyase